LARWLQWHLGKKMVCGRPPQIGIAEQRQILQAQDEAGALKVGWRH
jgi:hypothetical protein